MNCKARQMKSIFPKKIDREERVVLTWDILPNNEADVDLRLCGVKLAAPLAFRVRCSSNNSVDEFDNQYDNTSLFSWT
jgi:hypothetical protein